LLRAGFEAVDPARSIERTAADGGGALTLALPSAQDLARPSAAPATPDEDAEAALRACAHYLAGAWAAVEAIKACAQVGKSHALDSAGSASRFIVDAVFGSEED
jgi:hypothetical protein